MLATDLELPATTLARIIGHADAGFSLRVHAKDGRDEAAVVSDVLTRAPYSTDRQIKPDYFLTLAGRGRRPAFSPEKENPTVSSGF